MTKKFPPELLDIYPCSSDLWITQLNNSEIHLKRKGIMHQWKFPSEAHICKLRTILLTFNVMLFPVSSSPYQHIYVFKQSGKYVRKEKVSMDIKVLCKQVKSQYTVNHKKAWRNRSLAKKNESFERRLVPLGWCQVVVKEVYNIHEWRLLFVDVCKHKDGLWLSQLEDITGFYKPKQNCSSLAKRKHRVPSVQG